MAKHKTSSPSEAVNIVHDVMQLRGEEEIEKSLLRIRAEARKITKAFFKRFSAAAIGSIPSGGSLSADPYSPPRWAPLKPDTLRRKRYAAKTRRNSSDPDIARAGRMESRHVNSMFRYQRGLKTFFETANVTTVLGTPVAILRAGAGKGAIDVKLRETGGVYYWSSAGGSGGRRSYAAANQKRKFKIIVDLFPLLNTSANARQDLENTKIPQDQLHKLQNPRGEFRSALHPYAAWWVNTIATTRLAQVLSR